MDAQQAPIVLSRILQPLTSIAYSTCLTNNCNLNLTRISHLVLNFLCYISRQSLRSLIINLIGTNNYAELTTCLNCISLGNTRI